MTDLNLLGGGEVEFAVVFLGAVLAAMVTAGLLYAHHRKRKRRKRYRRD
jgi:hypothetical protein